MLKWSCLRLSNEIYGQKRQPDDYRCGNDETYFASDVPAILKYTRNVYYIGNLEIAQPKGKVAILILTDENPKMTEINGMRRLPKSRI